MSGSRSLTETDGSEYELIEATMAESARGRWFLQEYARRNRSADTEMLLGAIERLESVVTAGKSTVAEPDRVDRMRVDLMDMANAIARTKVEIAAISAPDADQSRLGVASTALDAIVLATERATSDILGAAEHVQEAAWTLRESGSDTAICGQLDSMATQIYTACSFQDLTAQRTARIIHTLRYLEERLGVMMAIWGDEIASVPPNDRGAVVPEELCQSDVDRFIGMEALGDATLPARPSLPEVADLNGDIIFLGSEPHHETAEARAEAATALLMAAVMEPVEEVSAQDDMTFPEDMARPDIPTASEDVAMAGESNALDEISDTMVSDRAEAEASAEPAALAKQPAARKPRRKKTDVATAFAEIDRMTAEEKAALFS